MYRLLLSAPAAVLFAISSFLVSAIWPASIRGQSIFYAEDTEAKRWMASASIGLHSPFGPDEFSVSWNGRHAIMATVEYFPVADASFGAYASHSTFDHTARSTSGPAECMRGLVRKQTGVGLIAHIYAVRWNGFRLLLGGSVGAANVARERPLLHMDGTAYGKVDMASSLDLGFGGFIGIEATIAPHTSVALEFGYEGIENQIVLNQSLLARTSLRVGL